MVESSVPPSCPAAKRKRFLVTGAGGFVGSHLATFLGRRGHWVQGVDIKESEFMTPRTDEFLLMDLRVARFHNIYGPYGTWTGGREKAPAAICRKVAEAPDGGTIRIWGDGKQTRSFCYIDDCLEGVFRLMESDFIQPINIGSDELVTIDQLADMVIAFSGKKLSKEFQLDKPQGVRGRNSDNSLIKKELHWAPSTSLEEGIAKTYPWIAEQVQNART